MKKKLISGLFIVSLLLATFSVPRPAKAVDTGALAQRVALFFTDFPGTIATIGEWAWEKAEVLKEIIMAQGVLAAKIAALLTVQKATSLVIGDGKDGTIIRDFNDYLYVSPQQKAMEQMNSFFNTTSRGRLSALNYEGVGPNYDAYLVMEAKRMIGGQQFSTNIQEQVTDPSQMFSGGNMKGIMSYMQCANNVPCYTLTSTARYNAELIKAQTLAREENVNGFVPKKLNGRIVQPAALAQSALSQMDKLGTDVILMADNKDPAAYAQIAQGAAISLTARLTNYGIADSEGREKIRNQNDEFPFSLGYSTNGGIGVTAGGVTLKTGIGSWTGFLQVGNVCAAGGFEVDARGAAVLINGQKRQCPYPSANSSSVTGPSITCTTGTLGDQFCVGKAGADYKCGTAGVCVKK